LPHKARLFNFVAFQSQIPTLINNFIYQNKTMKKLRWILVILFLGIGWLQAESLLNYEDFFIQYFEDLGQEVPPSYQYIELNYKNLDQNQKLHQALQKGVYLNFIPNAEVNFPWNEFITQKTAAQLIQKNFNIDIEHNPNGYVTDTRLNIILRNIEIEKRARTIDVDFTIQEKIMQDVYKTLSTYHINAENLDIQKMEYGAIKGMTRAVGDQYTIFFPPQESSAFQDEMNGKYEGIGAYVEMKNGKLMIVSPLEGSPAEKAGIQPGDIITYIDDEIVSEDQTIDSLVSKIKGTKDTKVKLTIQRNEETLDIYVTRENITVDAIKTSNGEMPTGTCYLAIKTFNDLLTKRFENAIQIMESQNCKKYIFDLRNNPGGSLQQASNILDYFVPTGQPKVHILSKRENDTYIAKEKNNKFTDKPIIILINKGSASASEIFAGTVNEYWTKTVLIWEKTFGKGSVQQVVEYIDGSSLKFTIAERFTGKLKKNINKHGIEPDIKIIDNPETELDEVLEIAKAYPF